MVTSSLQKWQNVSYILVFFDTWSDSFDALEFSKAFPGGERYVRQQIHSLIGSPGSRLWSSGHRRLPGPEYRRAAAARDARCHYTPLSNLALCGRVERPGSADTAEPGRMVGPNIQGG